MKSLVMYSSTTGNTKKVAEAIYETMAGVKEIHSVDEKVNFDEYDLIVAGYWVDKGICDNKSKEIIEKLNNKNIILFGTLGANDSGNYYESVKSKIEQVVGNSNKVLGHFLCQGKLNKKLAQTYNEMLKKNPDDEHIKVQIKNYNEGLRHPDDNDIENAKNFIKRYC